MILAWQTLEYLEFAFARQAIVAALGIATAASALSGIVVLKRLAFVGQGISHAAFGGIGVVAILGLSAALGELVIFGFCLASALAVAGLSRSRTEEDTAIGIVLVATMALGFLLLGLRQTLAAPGAWAWYRSFIAGAPRPDGWEAILFGSVHTAGPAGMWLSIAVMLFVLLTVGWFRRPLIAFVFDEVAARASGVRTQAIRILLMVLLALVVVVGMKLVGVVLISALLILPGAIAGQFTRRLAPHLLITWLTSVTGVLGGLILSFELDRFGLPTGPCIVLVLIALFAAGAAWRLIARTISRTSANTISNTS